MALKNYYELLGLDRSASLEDVKRAFRQQIARYHPDKVQHLGHEFQEMAASRSAELTEAYRVLSDEARRAEYDRAREAEPVAAAGPPAPAPSSAASEPAPRSILEPDETVPPPEGRPPGLFVNERAGRDEFVRKAALLRLKQAFAATLGGGYQEATATGFELAWQPKAGLFSRTKGPRMAGRFVTHLDGSAVADAWMQARQWAGDDSVCVFLVAPSLAPQSDLAAAVAAERRKMRGAKVTIVPIDALDWAAHVPVDAPALAKTLLARLRSGS